MTFDEAKRAEKEGKRVYYKDIPCYIIKSSNKHNLFEIEYREGIGRKTKTVTSYELEEY